MDGGCSATHDRRTSLLGESQADAMVPLAWSPKEIRYQYHLQPIYKITQYIFTC